jgi:RNA polymerase sigma factor (sigma-70 family)
MPVMPEPLRAVLDYVKRISLAQEMRTWADAELLQRFVSERNEAAFSALVHRHGPMVMSVCCRLLGDVCDAEDAFQATFMVLVRKAGSLGNSVPLGGWLYAVAQRVALKARAKAAVKRKRLRGLTDMDLAESLDELTWQELRPLLDEEVGRLPAKYRTPVVLCYFQGKSHDVAAQELGCPRKTVTNRLARARELLRGQLTRRGIALSAAALTTALVEKSIGTAVGAMLAIKTAKAAVSLAAGKTVAETILSAQAIALAEEVMRGMLAIKTKLVVFAMVLCLGLASAAGGMATALRVHAYNPALPSRSDVHASVEMPPIQETNKPAQAVDAYGDFLPPGAVARLGTVRWLHDDAVSFAAFLPDGKHVVTQAEDMTIRIWAFPSGKEMSRISVNLPVPDKSKVASLQSNGSSLCATLTKDGKKIATYWGGEEIYLHEIATGKELQRLKWEMKEGKGVLALCRKLAFSPTGDQLASLHDDGMLRLWDWAKAKQVHRFDPPFGDVSNPYRFYGPCLAYAPDGKLAVAYRHPESRGLINNNEEFDDIIKLYSSATGAEISSIHGKVVGGYPAIALAFSPDNKMLACTVFACLSCFPSSRPAVWPCPVGEGWVTCYGRNSLKDYLHRLSRNSADEVPRIVE